MSEENVKVVRRLYAETERGNFWVPEFFDPDIRIRWLDAVGTESETVGLEAMSDFMTNFLDVHENLTLTAERIIDAGYQVVVLSAWRGRGKASGVPTEWRFANLLTLREGKVVSIVAYSELTDALEAAGVSE
jgi:ketosteroid isomerase-like protein